MTLLRSISIRGANTTYYGSIQFGLVSGPRQTLHHHWIEPHIRIGTLDALEEAWHPVATLGPQPNVEEFKEQQENCEPEEEHHRRPHLLMSKKHFKKIYI
jgi:hypothetical protein